MSSRDGAADGRKPGVCDECGYRIKDGVGVHGRCADTDEDTVNTEPSGPPNPDQLPQRDNPNQCGCPACTNPMMDEMSGLCIKCETEGCDYYREWGVECE